VNLVGSNVLIIVVNCSQTAVCIIIIIMIHFRLCCLYVVCSNVTVLQETSERHPCCC